MNKRLLTLLLIGMVSISLVACTDDGTQSNNNIQEEQQSSNEEEANEKVIESIKHGKLLDVNINEDQIIIKRRLKTDLVESILKPLYFLRLMLYPIVISYKLLQKDHILFS